VNFFAEQFEDVDDVVEEAEDGGVSVGCKVVYSSLLFES